MDPHPQRSYTLRCPPRLTSRLALGLVCLHSLAAARSALAQNSKPDLAPTTLSAAALQFPINSCTARVGVSNRGLTAAPASKVSLGYQVNPDGSVTELKVNVPSVPAKTLLGDGFAYSNWISGLKLFSNKSFINFTVKVDADNEIFEGSAAAESNNTKTFSYHAAQSPSQLYNGVPAGCVARPDLQVTQLEWDKNSCALNLKVQNLGAADTSPLNQPQNFFVSVRGLRENTTGNTSWSQNIPRLKKGETYSAQITGFRADLNTDTTRALADVTQVLTESEETKNQRDVVAPMNCYYNPIQRCDFFITSYSDPDADGEDFVNVIEKLRHVSGTNTFESVGYWVGAKDIILNDIAAMNGDSVQPDDVRVIRPGNLSSGPKIEKVRFLPNNQFDFDPGMSQSTNGGFDGGTIDVPTDPSSTAGPTLYTANGLDIIKAPLAEAASGGVVATIEGLTGQIGILSSPLDQILDNVYFKGTHFVSYYRSSQDDTVLFRLNGTDRKRIGAFQTATGGKPRITGLSLVGANLYGLGQDRKIYQINPETAQVTLLTALPSTAPGSNIPFGKGFGMTVKCTEEALPLGNSELTRAR